MKYVVTGGGGFIGSRIVKRLLDKDPSNQVVAFDNLSSGQLKNLDQFKDDPRFSFVQGDIVDKPSVMRTITPGVNAVFHLSAVVGVKTYVADPLKVVDVNVIGTRNVLEAALQSKAKVIFTSTSEIFGKNPNTPWKEDADRVLGATSVDRWSYSTSKAMCEHMIFAMCKYSGLSASIVRFFNIYGPGQAPYFVVSQSVQKVLKNEQPLLYDSGEQTRCFTFVDDAVEGTLRAAEDPKALGDVFNIGNSKETTIREVVEAVIELAGKKGVITPKNFDTAKQYGAGYEDIPHRVPDVSKAKRVLGWEATTSLHDGLRKTIDWARENQWWLDLKN